MLLDWSWREGWYEELVARLLPLGEQQCEGSLVGIVSVTARG